MKNFTKKLTTIIILVVLLSSPITPVFANLENIGEKESYVVTSNSKTIDKLQERYGGDISDDGKVLSDVELTEGQIKRIEKEDQATIVEKDIILTADLKHKKHKKNNNSSEIVQWNLDALGIKNAEEDSEKIKIAIIDSGFSFSDDFTVAESKNFIDDDLNENPLFDDTTGHGTAMGGIIGAYDNQYGITGVNPNAELYSAKVLDSNNQAPLSRIVEGIYWAIDNNVDIINMSFGTTVDSEILHNAIKTAHNAGIILVASSGNNAEGNVKYPAKYDEVIGVGALGVNGQIWEDTSRGEGLDLLAPGQKIETTGIFSGVLSTCGTSISAAQVSGVASLLLQRDKTKSPDFIKDLLIASSKTLEYDGGTVGIVDYAYASEIYDNFADNYSEENQTAIPSNTNTIEDFTKETSAIVEGMWGGNNDSTIRGHGKMANDASTEAGLSTYYMGIVNYACTHVDAYYGSKGSKTPGVNYTNIGHKVQTLHGRGNYVATSRFLSNFAQYMGQGLSKSQALSKCQSKFPSIITYDSTTGQYVDATTSHITGEASDGQLLLELVTAVGEMYDDLVNTTSQKSLYQYYSSGSIGPNRRMLVFLGVTLHVMGDVYSHRTIVNNYTVANGFSDTLTYDSNNHSDRFCKLDFNQGTPTQTLTLAQIKEYVKPLDPFTNAFYSNTNTNNPYRYPVWLQTGVAAGVVEFQDVTKFEYAVDSNGAFSYGSWTAYDDRAGFCKERYNNALNRCKEYLSDIIDANFPTFTDVKKYYIRYLFPTDDYVKLNNLKNYTTAAGLSTTAYSNSNWSTHSTSNYV